MNQGWLSQTALGGQHRARSGGEARTPAIGHRDPARAAEPKATRYR